MRSKSIGTQASLAVLSLILLTSGLLISGLSDARAEEPEVFKVQDIQFLGYRAMSLPKLKKAVEPLIGREVAPVISAEIFEAVDTLYKESGYHLYTVLVPEYLGHGTYRVGVRETPISRIEVSGNQHTSERTLQHALPALRTGESLNFKSLERQLAFANNVGGRKIDVNFSANEQGEVVASIGVQDQKPWSVGISADNSGNEETGDWRTTLTASYNNLWQRDHEVIVTLTKSPEEWDALKQYGFYYRAPFPQVGGRLTLNLAYSDTDSGRVAGAFDISGRGTHVLANWQQMIASGPGFGHYLRFGFAHKDFENTVDFFGTDLGVDVVSRPVSLAYDFERSRKVSAGQLSLAGSVGASVNVPGGGDNTDAAYSASRTGASASWSKWDGRFSAQLQTAKDWVLKGQVQGQYSDEPLISGEQFGVGGAFSVRGLEERKGAGDKGLFASLEMMSPERKGHRGLLFVDAGKYWRNQALPGEVKSDGVASVGVGWRWHLDRRFTVSADAGTTLHDFGDVEKGEVRAHIRLTASF